MDLGLAVPQYGRFAALPSVLRVAREIDHLSGGRLNVGLGLGWSSDEYAAAGVPWRDRARRYDATLDALEAIWGSDPVAFEHELWTIAPSHIEPKPARRPPLYLAGFAGDALRRIGRTADGWLTAALPIPALTSMWRTVGESAERAGRDPGALRMVLRSNPVVTGQGTPPRSGTVARICAYLADAAEAGVHEVILDLQHTATGDQQLLELAEEFRATLNGLA
jgi:hypothetical protein